MAETITTTSDAPAVCFRVYPQQKRRDRTDQCEPAAMPCHAAFLQVCSQFVYRQCSLVFHVPAQPMPFSGGLLGVNPARTMVLQFA